MSRSRTIRSLAAIVAAAAAFSLAPATATEHCNKSTNFLTGAGLLLNPRSVGCDVIAEDFPETEGDDSNTDWIVPGATQGVVRFLNSEAKPLDGEKDAVTKEVSGSFVDLDGTLIPIRWEQGEGVDGTPSDFWDSQFITIGRTASLRAVATITVCRTVDDCEVVVYRGVLAE